jgi:hypothetical protein
MTFFTKVQTLTLVLLLVCVVCIAPGMAGTKTHVIVDGVHLIKFDDSPTRLDPRYYDIDTTEDVLVDGDQYYWVRIGNVKAEGLTTHTQSMLLCYGAFLGVAGAVDGFIAVIAAPAAAAAAPPTLGGSVILYAVAVGSVITIVDGAIGWTAMQVCPEVERQLIDKKYRVVASDGTILLGIKKDNTAGIQELKKDGIDIKALTHLSKEGKVLNPNSDL